MCFSGRCCYEDWEGECMIRRGQLIPTDALCAVSDQMDLDPEYVTWLNELDKMFELEDIDEEDMFGA